MNRKDAEKMADDIFDMIDRNHPRGLIKSELVDLLAKYDTGHRDIKRDVTETGETAFSDLLSITPEKYKFAFDDASDELEKAKEQLKGLGYYFHEDPCDND